MKGREITIYNITHTDRDLTQGSFNLRVYLHVLILYYNEDVSSVNTVQVNRVTLYVTCVHKDPTLFRRGERIVYALNEGAKHRNQDVN